ncbi:hypothetical protein [Methanoplanus limicola]|uniref:Uncharacterized protein n=1 Tax=Methanoplanus limicola DSM 2279 TaxID=937775 RepID=H1Z1A8_9EURY|nr:hypothetical protein [Methanoplanus limicola]EHQ35375.1 hypothetical protein Metlim_1266 [Methanoplanus limicola DSM 2279]
MKKILLPFLLLVLALFIIPASAGNYSTLGADYLNTDVTIFDSVTSVNYDVSGGSGDDLGSLAITKIEIYGLSSAKIVNFTLTQWNGVEHTGQINYTAYKLGDVGYSYYSLELDGESKAWEGLDVTPEKVFLTSYVKEEDTQKKGLLISEVSFINYILRDDKCVFSEASDIDRYPLKKITLASTSPVNVGITYADTEVVLDSMDNENIDVLAWIGNILSFAGSVGTIIFGLIYVFKLLFVDHLLSIIVLYESVCMAYSASQSRDIISFLRKFIRYNRALVEALIGFISVVISIFHKIIDAIKPF